MFAHLEDEFGGYEMDWRRGDEAIWLRRTSKGWYPYHHIKCLIVVPGTKYVGIALHNQATREWTPKRVAISSLIWLREENVR